MKQPLRVRQSKTPCWAARGRFRSSRRMRADHGRRPLQARDRRVATGCPRAACTTPSNAAAGRSQPSRVADRPGGDLRRSLAGFAPAGRAPARTNRERRRADQRLEGQRRSGLLCARASAGARVDRLACTDIRPASTTILHGSPIRTMIWPFACARRCSTLVCRRRGTTASGVHGGRRARSDLHRDSPARHGGR